MLGRADAAAAVVAVGHAAVVVLEPPTKPVELFAALFVAPAKLLMVVVR